jgi:hypothetical protein
MNDGLAGSCRCLVAEKAAPVARSGPVQPLCCRLDRRRAGDQVPELVVGQVVQGYPSACPVSAVIAG